MGTVRRFTWVSTREAETMVPTLAFILLCRSFAKVW
jgi:hypothetical protein